MFARQNSDEMIPAESKKNLADVEVYLEDEPTQ